jgi:dihydroceramide fatty acyl 2-hydroxylase
MTNDAARSLSDSPRIFDNAFLDRFSRIDHRIPPMVYGPLILGLTAFAIHRIGILASLEGLLIGYVSWTLTEYFGHRYIFHFEMKSRLGARIHFLIHGIHHDYPSDPLRLVMPLLMSLPIIALAALIVLSIGGALALPILAGFIAGYVAYDMVHYHVHHGTAHTAFGRYLKRTHMLHHFRTPDRWYGVSAPWWDAVFRTTA